MSDCALRRPMVSIVTPTLNAMSFLDQYAQSVLGQTYDRLEIVFVDGGSTDGTLDRLHEYQRSDPDRVRLLTDVSGGPGEAWNLGLKAARGDIFGCLGADDVCEPGALQAVAGFFEAHPEVDFVHGHCDFIDEPGRVIFRHRVSSAFDFYHFVNTAVEIATPSAYYRRRVMEQIGWLDSSGDDFDVMLRIAKAFEIHTLDEVLSRLRIREDSAFNRLDLSEHLLQVRETFRISRRHGGRRFSPLAWRYYCYWGVMMFRLTPVYRLLKSRRALKAAGTVTVLRT